MEGPGVTLMAKSKGKKQGVDSSAKRLSFSKPSRKKAAPVMASANGLMVLTSGFDFTEGGFKKAERTRRVLLGCIGACALGAMSFGVMGLQAHAQASSDQAQATVASERAASDLAQLAVLDQAGGFTAEQLRAHVTAREAASRAAQATQADTLRITNAVLAAAPTGVLVNNITISWADPPAAQPTGSESPSSTSKKSSSGKEAATAVEGRRIAVTAVADEFSKIAGFDSALKKIPGLEGVVPQWTGGGTAWTVTVTGELSPAAKGASR